MEDRDLAGGVERQLGREAGGGLAARSQPLLPTGASGSARSSCLRPLQTVLSGLTSWSRVKRWVHISVCLYIHAHIGAHVSMRSAYQTDTCPQTGL